jgi:hypothetical protein
MGGGTWSLCPGVRARLHAYAGVLALLSLATSARADPGASGDASPAPYRRLIVSAELLGLIVHRYGLEVEVVLSPHDSVAVYSWAHASDDFGETRSPFDFTLDIWDGPPASYEVSTHAVGLDFEYRRYLSKSLRGPQGFFVAPGFVVQGFRADTWRCVPGADAACAPLARQEWAYLGPSFDIGGQAILPWGTVLASTVGLLVRVPTIALDESVLPGTWHTLDGPGVQLRWQLSVGWAAL